MSKNNLFSKEFLRAKEADQDHLFDHFQFLFPDQQDHLLAQVQDIDYDFMNERYQKSLGIIETDRSLEEIATKHKYNTTHDIKAKGTKHFQDGRVAYLTVAGGNGTRLGHDGPKGTFTATPVSQRSLFEVFANNILEINKKFRHNHEWYIMTSKRNNQETKDFFRNHNYFNLNKNNIVFFEQEDIPVVDEKGKIMLADAQTILKSANGHGGVYQAIEEADLISRMKDKQVTDIIYFQVDNPLLDLADERFLGEHISTSSTFSSKAVLKNDAHESVGVFAKINGKPGVIEYNQMTDAQKEELNTQGNLKYAAGNIAAHILNTDFVEHIINTGLGEYTRQHKKEGYFDINSLEQIPKPEKENCYKFERFIFDAMDRAQNPLIYLVSREEEFAPIKNIASSELSKKMQVEKTKRWMSEAGYPKMYLNNLISAELGAYAVIDKERFLQEQQYKRKETLLPNTNTVYLK